ncbi:cytochrome-c peroxidase [Dyadobacter psychrophilus]|uniref:Cytochrome c peroxidase n=1 Tax=Dyadobacter psychrophilus TaxID=651661 RepID=A0A1T5H5J5_9BACT|nr:cytochrome c peroxidase [Dyadobacter psychrophilus]SKC15810.1 cytochrome c peroxidase [Dyadobacter psychrophilus]
MKNKLFSALCLAVVILFCAAIFRTNSPAKTDAARQTGKIYLNEMHRLDSMLVAYPNYFMDSNNAARLRVYTDLARQFKRVELFFLYFYPEKAYETIWQPIQATKQPVGPPLPDNFLIAGPFGIDADSIVVKSSKANRDFEKMFITRAANNFRTTLAETQYEKRISQITDAQIMEAMRLQLFNISSVGLGNGDFQLNPVNLPCVQAEVAVWSKIMRIYLAQLPRSSKKLKTQVEDLLDETEKFFLANTDFDAFDRMELLTNYLNPLSKHLAIVRKTLNIPTENRFAALNPEASGLFDADIFNLSFFMPDSSMTLFEERAELGKILFFDPILSDNNERSCASCHKPEMAFTDGLGKSMSFTLDQLPRNAPTIINSVFQPFQFWDARVNSLEDQADSVIMNPNEMHGTSFEIVAERITASEDYIKLFNTAFPETIKHGIARKHIKSAIASYERTLVGLNSRFDKYMRGEKAAMSIQEINGFNVFMGKGRCGSCHYAPLFNGTLPPHFSISDHRSLGVPVKDTMSKYEIDADVGLQHSKRNPLFKSSFKVPTVRNAAITAPYMHNGIYQTLDQVVNFYNHGAGNKFGFRGLFLSILPDSLNLSATEKKDLISFVHALTDTSGTSARPRHLPEIKGKHAALNDRIIGGKF